MSKKPLGFVSVTGMVVAAIFLTIVGAGMAMGGPVMYQPGQLSTKTNGKMLGGVKSHAETGGTCQACHAEPWSTDNMAGRCMVCHANVKAEISSKKGVHGSLLGNVKKPTCRGCHTDHAGADAKLTVIDGSFPHDLTGYTLAGHQRTIKGPAFACKDCHPKGLSQFTVSTCTDCHATIDPTFTSQHQTAFGSDCLLCHRGARSETDFNHNTFAFKLAGAHANVPCRGCHTTQKSLAALKSTAQKCYSCHGDRDVHGGAMGQACESCHTTTDWTVVSFDHTLLKSATAKSGCYSCHSKDDPHGGALGKNCAQCHRTATWKGASFNHNSIRSAPNNCASCHAKNDPHGGQYGGQCGQCHTTSSWIGVTFTHQFPVRHGGARNCRSCHPNGTRTYSCASCHAGIHGGRGTMSNCIRCHANGGEHGEGGGHEREGDDD
jgi:hypothetical protein